MNELGNLKTTEGMSEEERIVYAKEALLAFPIWPSEDGSVSSDMLYELQELNFFTAPAAAHHHSNYEGGLFDHSIMVAQCLTEITMRMGLSWDNPRSPLVIGLLHDLCKVDQYQSTATGYKYNDDTLYTGHGDKSVFLASTILRLTGEEVACIRYHMGAFTDKEEWKYYTKAVQTYPNVLWTHTADMIASQVEGV